jgi:hypothetical protein
MPQPTKSCFVIMPISDPEGYESGHFRYIYTNLIQEACKRAGYEPIRADDVPQANLIVQDLIERILVSDMVVCDLSARNPNVMYELGIRHAAQKPAVLITDTKTGPIFDIQGIRTPRYSWMARGEQLEKDILSLTQSIISTAQSATLTNSPIAALPKKLQALLNGVQTFSKRDDLTGDEELKEALRNYSHLDIIGLSAEVAITTFKESLNAALRRKDFSCRFIIFDPSPITSIHYEALVAGTLKQSPVLKRAQAQEVFDLANFYNTPIPTQQKMRVKVLRDKPLLYNLWVASDDLGVARIGHISIYSYDIGRGGPAFRVADPSAPLLMELQNEFNYVWDNIAEEYD